MDDIYFRILFLAVGLLVGWMAGVIQCTKNYAREAKREARECKRELKVLERQINGD